MTITCPNQHGIQERQQMPERRLMPNEKQTIFLIMPMIDVEILLNTIRD